MAVKNKYVIMCVGHTHTGKTTFAKKLTRTLSSIVLIDNDEIASFINEKYPAAVWSPYNKIKRTYQDPNLKFLLSQDIFKFCLRVGLNVIHASGNLGKDARLVIISNAKKYHYKLITIYFNLPRKIILSRIQKTKKDTRPFKSSRNWPEVLEKQDSYAELPPSKNNTIYFEIKNVKDSTKILKELNTILLK